MSASAIAGLKMFLQKGDQPFSPLSRTRFCQNNLNVTIIAFEKVAATRIFYTLHVITSNTLQHILYLNISIISNIDICTKSDTWAHVQRALLEKGKKGESSGFDLKESYCFFPWNSYHSFRIN